jgi:hypothetical protein
MRSKVYRLWSLAILFIHFDMLPWTGIGPPQGLYLKDNTNTVKTVTYSHVPSSPSMERQKASNTIDMALKLWSAKYIYLAILQAKKRTYRRDWRWSTRRNFRLACSLHTWQLGNRSQCSRFSAWPYWIFVAQTPLRLESASVYDGHVLVLQMLCYVTHRKYSWTSESASQVKTNDTEDVSDNDRVHLPTPADICSSSAGYKLGDGRARWNSSPRRPPSLPSIAYQGLFLEAKRLECETDYPSPTSAEVKNMRLYTATPQYVFTV